MGTHHKTSVRPLVRWNQFWIYSGKGQDPPLGLKCTKRTFEFNMFYWHTNNRFGYFFLGNILKSVLSWFLDATSATHLHCSSVTVLGGLTKICRRISSVRLMLRNGESLFWSLLDPPLLNWIHHYDNVHHSIVVRLIQK